MLNTVKLNSINAQWPFTGNTVTMYYYFSEKEAGVTLIHLNTFSDL